MFVICGCIRYTLTEVSSISDVRYITLLTMEHTAADFYRNTGYYCAHYTGRYHHSVYKGHFHSRPEFRKHDFIAPRPVKNPGYHFTPARPSAPAAPSHRPEARPPYRPGISAKPAPKPVPKPDKRPPHASGIRPPQNGNHHSVRPGTSRPSDKAPNRVTRPSRTERKDNRPSVRPERKENQETS